MFFVLENVVLIWSYNFQLLGNLGEKCEQPWFPLSSSRFLWMKGVRPSCWFGCFFVLNFLPGSHCLLCVILWYSGCLPVIVCIVVWKLKQRISLIIYDRKNPRTFCDSLEGYTVLLKKMHFVQTFGLFWRCVYWQVTIRLVLRPLISSFWRCVKMLCSLFCSPCYLSLVIKCSEKYADLFWKY